MVPISIRDAIDPRSGELAFICQQCASCGLAFTNPSSAQLPLKLAFACRTPVQQSHVSTTIPVKSRFTKPTTPECNFDEALLLVSAK